MTETVRLSCEQCKSRKTRCDKKLPCSACRANSLPCQPVQRARLPRGRTGNSIQKGTTLRAKVARLEKLVAGLENQVSDVTLDVCDNEDGSLRSVAGGSRSEKLETLPARDFWVALSNEIAGLREVLEDSDDGHEEHGVNSQPSSYMQPQSMLLFNGRPSTLLSLTERNAYLPVPSSDARLLFIQLYRARVDWLLKILHWPSTATMLDRCSTCADSESAPAEFALQYAIFFLAICTLSDGECAKHKLGFKVVLLEQYQRAVELLLSQADLLITTDITALQAFVLYIAAIRSSVSAASAWSLIALAVRIARACSLDCENAGIHSAFEVEVRRRLWHGIGFLDSQTSFGRGTVPLLSHQDLTRPPKIIDDTEMSPVAVNPQTVCRFTEMSFSSLCHEAMVCQRKLVDPSFGTWQERLEVVNLFERWTQQNFSQYGNSTDSRQRYTAFAARSMPVTMQLLLRRPLYKNYQNAVPPGDEPRVLDIGCQVLQTGLAKSQSVEFRHLSWFKWPKWFALAVVLVELCSKSFASGSEEAFLIAQESYNDYAQSATDLGSGQLWKPITKLMHRAQKMRAARKSNKSCTTGSGLQQHTKKIAGFPLYDQPDSVSLSGDIISTPWQLCSRPDEVHLSIPADSHVESNDIGLWLEWDMFLTDMDGPYLYADLL